MNKHTIHGAHTRNELVETPQAAVSGLSALTGNYLHEYLVTAVSVNFPINVDILHTQMTAHPDRVKVHYIVNGLKDVFRTGFYRDKISLISAQSNCADKYLAEEIHARRVIGPFDHPPFPNIHISRFGVIPKKNKLDAWRLILDLSFPTGDLVIALMMVS